ncbi:hypothetical protein chiPu_0031564, partial [Chiloscyllium punctatum]|nr:hypothetical protein [Chiloscyllium punctatum]
AFARDLHHTLHGAADYDHLAVGRVRGVDYRPHPGDIGGEGRDRDPALGGLDQLLDGSGDLGLRGRAPVAHGIGGIADQRQHAFVAELPQPPLVGRLADHRGRIDLPVAGVQHGADVGLDRQRVRFRNRMRDRNEFDVERADIDPAARRDHGDRDLRRIALGGAFGLEQRRRELRRVDLAAKLRPEVDDRAEMILMGVRQHEAHQVVALLLQEAD